MQRYPFRLDFYVMQHGCETFTHYSSLLIDCFSAVFLNWLSRLASDLVVEFFGLSARLDADFYTYSAFAAL